MGQLVLLFNSKIKLFPGKLRSRCLVPFTSISAWCHRSNIPIKRHIQGEQAKIEAIFWRRN